MDNQVFEEAPVAAGDSARQLEKHARQLAYDTRYFVKKQLGGKPVNAATMERLLLQRLQKSTAVPAVKARAKEMLVGKINKKVVASEETQIVDLATDTVANALYKVFVEGASKNEEFKLDYLEELFDDDRTKYKVRVTDVDKGSSYIRFATRDKITELRQKGLKVERTEHGDPREDEAKQGSQTAAALGGGKAKKDYDGDGKIESGAKEYRGAVHNAIQRKKGGTPDGKDTSSVKEDYIRELNSSQNTNKKITGFVDNSSLVKVFPEDKSDLTSGGANARQGMKQNTQPMTAGYEMEGSFISEKAVSKAQQRFMGMVYAKKKGEMSDASPEVTAAAKSISTKEAKKFAKTKHKGLPVHKEEKGSSCEKDPRSLPTERELIKNKLRAALGVKNPIVMTAGYEPEGKNVDEGLGVLAKGALAAGALWAAAKGMESAKKGVDKKIQDARKNSPIGGDRYSSQMKQLGMSYEPEGDVVSEEGSDKSSDRSRESGDWRSRSQRGPVRRKPSVADDPRYGSMSDEEWSKSSHNPANKRRRR